MKAILRLIAPLVMAGAAATAIATAPISAATPVFGPDGGSGCTADGTCGHGGPQGGGGCTAEGICGHGGPGGGGGCVPNVGCFEWP
jgi:hypothetical protein